jgi:hypothetical protein
VVRLGIRAEKKVTWSRSLPRAPVPPGIEEGAPAPELRFIVINFSYKRFLSVENKTTDSK